MMMRCHSQYGSGRGCPTLLLLLWLMIIVVIVGIVGTSRRLCGLRRSAWLWLLMMIPATSPRRDRHCRVVVSSATCRSASSSMIRCRGLQVRGEGHAQSLRFALAGAAVILSFLLRLLAMCLSGSFHKYESSESMGQNKTRRSDAD